MDVYSEVSPEATQEAVRRPAVARLVDIAGRDQSATPRDVAGQLQSGGFFWLDLENPDEGELAEFCQSLRLSADAIDSVMHPSQRSSFALAAGSVQAVLPAAVSTRPTAWQKANYVTLLLTGQFLFSVHATPSAPRSGQEVGHSRPSLWFAILNSINID
jgi:Mg2+ and Co2+ transporter CorA